MRIRRYAGSTGETELVYIGFEFSRSDINDLAQTLAKAQLTAGEQALLLAVFSAAGDSVTVMPTASPAAPQTTPNLEKQIVAAFIPSDDANATNFILPFEKRLARVTPGTPQPKPHPPPNPNPDPNPDPSSPGAGG
jgi:hypothetical protein